MKITVSNIDSSILKSFVYDRDIPFRSGELSVTFKNNHIYYYENVDMFDVFELMSATTSVGMMFNSTIKNKYKHFDKAIPTKGEDNE